MPSFGKRLAAEFEAEFARLANDWYLKWHDLARGEPIDVDDFRGGRIRPQSTHYDAAAAHSYWAASRRYAMSKIADVFGRADEQIVAQGGIGAEAIIEETAITLRSFLEKLHRHAVYTEHRLQERGYPEERYLDSRRDHAVLAEIQRRKATLLAKYHHVSWMRQAVTAVTGPRARRLVLLVFFVSMVTGGAAAVFRYTG
jgi:hypothetical protein